MLRGRRVPRVPTAFGHGSDALSAALRRGPLIAAFWKQPSLCLDRLSMMRVSEGPVAAVIDEREEFVAGLLAGAERS